MILIKTYIENFSKEENDIRLWIVEKWFREDQLILTVSSPILERQQIKVIKKYGHIKYCESILIEDSPHKSKLFKDKECKVADCPHLRFRKKITIKWHIKNFKTGLRNLKKALMKILDIQK